MAKRSSEVLLSEDDYATRQARWSEQVMEETTKAWVKVTLERAVERMGQVGQDNVSQLVTLTTIRTRFKQAGTASPADVVWSWLADELAANSHRVEATLQRRSTGRDRRILPRWRWYSQVRSGWSRPTGMEVAQLITMQEADRVLSMLWWKQEGREWDEYTTKEVLLMRQSSIETVWQAVKRSGYQGPGGYGEFLKVLALLMMWGDVEGSIGKSPEGVGWNSVKEQAEMMGVSGVQETWDEELEWGFGQFVPDQAAQGRDLVVDWMSCTQSLRASGGKEVMYLPYDKQEWVFSSKLRRWVRNIPVDLMKLSGPQLWDRVQADVRRRYGKGVTIGKVFLAMSPCCKTFSKVDSTNVSRGNHYRLSDTEHPLRPPKDSTSEKGLQAHAADRMVKHGITVAKFFVAMLQATFYMENPVGSLCKRPYMVEWVESGVREAEIHYCAYRHFYHKPTHLWTNLMVDRWTPRGSTGTGQCENRCNGGSVGISGKWTHTYKLAQGSTQAKGGRGRKANKNMMPQALHEELLKAAGLRTVTCRQ